ncbi:HtaA domain-containing protein [Baekduia sp. Peel2402]|uniref:HtaA domain-containing protein n=1 Tax=Baekduia sp. Peel2402 TaxID=3458296 RepID=UPI00403EF394
MTRPAVLATAVAAALAAVVPASAQAAASGTSVLTFKGTAASSLSSAGVKASAVSPATAKGKAVTFPVKTVTVGSAATLGHSGSIRFKKGSRTLTLKTPALRLAATGSRLTAKVDGKTTTILTVDAAKRSLNATNGTVSLKSASVKLTSAGAAAIKKALKLRSLRSGTLGTLTVDATTGATTGTGGTGSTGGGSTGSGSTGTGTTGGGTTGGGTPGTPADNPKSCTKGPVVVPAGGPTALTAPVTSVPVMSASITWHVRDSFIQYINTGEGTAVANGATADPKQVQPGSSASLVYQFHFPFKDGWYDPVSDTTRLTFTGTVLFCYFDHGIKLTASNPEIEINGNSASRGIFITDNTDVAAKRGVLVNLDLANKGAATNTPPTHEWAQVPGKIPTNTGDSTFAGYYAAGDPFGWITVTASTS